MKMLKWKCQIISSLCSWLTALSLTMLTSGPGNEIPITSIFFLILNLLSIPHSGPTRWWWKPGTGTTARATAVSLRFYFQNTSTFQVLSVASRFSNLFELEKHLKPPGLVQASYLKVERLASCTFILEKVPEWFIFQWLECDAKQPASEGTGAATPQECTQYTQLVWFFVFVFSCGKNTLNDLLCFSPTALEMAGKD